MKPVISARARRSFVPAAALVAAAGFTAPANGREPPPPATERATALTEATFEQRLALRTNTRRAIVKCPPLRVSSTLTRAARLHSARMGNRDLLSHRVPGEPTLATRIRNAGYVNWRMLAENIAYSTTRSPDRVFDSWIRSTAHRRNIQNCRLKEIGIGVQYVGGKTWATQDFGRR